ncbi:hypothetical protein Z947_1548 [Sulfitobacter geojensis]|nr:hypothetical protein Z947_1548 [Sulfitobacter geojensis]
MAFQACDEPSLTVLPDGASSPRPVHAFSAQARGHPAPKCAACGPTNLQAPSSLGKTL